MKLKLLSLLCAAALCGCSLDPVYQRPAGPVDPVWPTGPAYDTDTLSTKGASGTASLAADVGWRDFFKDARLQRLIELALENNRDLRVAALKVAGYEAQYRITRAALAPTIDASGSTTRERSQGAVTGASSMGVGTTSWEIDFFGRLGSLKRQALEQYLASDASRTSTQLSLIATVATDYLQLRADEALLKITADTVEADRQTYELTLRSQQIGNASVQDV